ncbi:MAG TPA: hypothetical protein P5121_29525, partial [Caldilineaceae bacterium]|nr:hypothetical protein [Caldilineaceae bacterium]
MSFQQKNVAVTLSSFSLILIFFSVRVYQLIQQENFTESNLFWLWGIVIFMAVVVTIVAMILTHTTSTIFEVFRTGNKHPEIEDFEDERDKLIDLRGTKITYTLSSLGVFVAMLTFVFGQPPLVMFTLLIFFGLLAQVIGDITRLLL